MVGHWAVSRVVVTVDSRAVGWAAHWVGQRVCVLADHLDDLWALLTVVPKAVDLASCLVVQ